MRKGDWRGFWRNPEMRATIATLVGGGLLVGVLLWAHGNYGFVEALRHGVFHTISVASTTGYSTLDYLQGWPVFAPIFMLLLSSVATSAGSTGCGVKMVRVLILVQQARREFTRLVHPHAVQPVTLGGKVVGHQAIFSVLAFMLVYGGTVLGLSMLMLLSGLEPVAAFGAVLATVNCVGPGLGSVGPAGNYSTLSDFQVWVCTFAMVLGRLELLSFIALLTPSFWRK
jgi:trk system potassium uptake protein TrkH